MPRNYKDTTGGLTVEKKEPTAQEKAKNEEVTKARLAAEKIQATEKNKLTYVKLVDTLFSYLPSNMSIVDNSTKGVCSICGIQTAYANRHICPVCLSKEKHKLLSAIEVKLPDEEVEF